MHVCDRERQAETDRERWNSHGSGERQKDHGLYIFILVKSTMANIITFIKIEHRPFQKYSIDTPFKVNNL